MERKEEKLRMKKDTEGKSRPIHKQTKTKTGTGRLIDR